MRRRGEHMSEKGRLIVHFSPVFAWRGEEEGLGWGSAVLVLGAGGDRYRGMASGLVGAGSAPCGEGAIVEILGEMDPEGSRPRER